MAVPVQETPDVCGRCGVGLTAHALVCGGCSAMVHSKRLEALAASAQAHEERADLPAARRDWQSALELLPADSSQAGWVRSKLDALTPGANQPKSAQRIPGWTRKLGPFAPVALLLLKGKFLFSLLKLKFLLSFAAFAGVYWALYGAWFGLGLAVLILIHELGHLIAVRRRGLNAQLPMFIPGFGAYVRWQATNVTAEIRARVSLAGPLAGLIGAVCCMVIFLRTQDGLWAGLASFSAFINLMNLIPLWTLDGGQAMPAINRAGRIGIAIAAVLFAVYFKAPLMLLVAAGASYRAFEQRCAELPTNLGITAYFIILVASLGFLSTLAPLGAGR